MDKESYKESGVGIIPETWDYTPLKEFCKFKNGKATDYFSDLKKGENYIYGSNGPIGSLDKANLESGFIIGRVGAVGEIHKIDTPVWVSDNAIKLEIKNGEKVDSNYLYYWLKKRNLGQFATKSAQPLLNQSTVKSIPIPVPKYSEQKKIATILLSLDEVIEKTNQIIEKNTELKKSLIQQLITKGISHDKLVEAKINGKKLRIPNNWKVDLIKEITNINQKNISTDTPEDYEIEYIDISSINDIGEIKKTNIYKYKNAPSRAKRLVDLNDIIVSTVRPYLKSFSVIKRQQENLVCSTGFAVLSPKSNMISEYIYYFVWSSLFVNYMKRLMRGTSYPAVNIDDVANASILVPPLEEQKKIAAILSTVDNKIKKELEYKEKLIKLKKGLMQVLLTGKVRTVDKDIPIS